MRLLVSVDDTDDLTKNTSTGKIAEMIEKKLIKQGFGVSYGITRHQLLLHEDIPYTSHNSAMCFVMDVEKECEKDVYDIAIDIINSEKSLEADPGLCICFPDNVDDIGALIEYGLRAQKEVLCKNDAYSLAKHLGIHLSEHGGDGQGVIGALAGIGLRLSGRDGRFRGKLKSKSETGHISVKELCKELKVSEVRTVDGCALEEDTNIKLGDYAKSILWQHKKVVIVMINTEGEYETCTKKQMSDIIKGWEKTCDNFTFDNDEEETLGDDGKSCYDCLYRRWTAEGFGCTYKH